MGVWDRVCCADSDVVDASLAAGVHAGRAGLAGGRDWLKAQRLKVSAGGAWVHVGGDFPFRAHAPSMHKRPPSKSSPCSPQAAPALSQPYSDMQCSALHCPQPDQVLRGHRQEWILRRDGRCPCPRVRQASFCLVNLRLFSTFPTGYQRIGTDVRAGRHCNFVGHALLTIAGDASHAMHACHDY